jgi:Protein of unknown function (DUF3891)
MIYRLGEAGLLLSPMEGLTVTTLDEAAPEAQDDEDVLILQRFRGQLLVVHLTDHSRQVGEFAHHWGNDVVSQPSPRSNVLEAATVHDGGWASDTYPPLNPETGWPRDFRGLSPHYQVPMYRGCVEQALARGPFQAMLVSLHLSGLYNNRFGTAPMPRTWNTDERALAETFLAEQENLRRTLAPTVLGRPMRSDITEETELWRNYRLLQIWDRLSILYTFRLAAGGELAPLPLPNDSETRLQCTAAGELSMTLDPYPFDDSPGIFPLPAKLIPDHRYASVEAFREALERTPVTILECRASRI